MQRFLGLLLFGALFLVAVPVGADDGPVSTPIYRWLATPCQTWGCAIGALAEANGDPHVVMLPTKSPHYPWVVLRRVEAGAFDGPIDTTFDVECFSKMVDASLRFDAIPTAHMPMLVTTPDGGMLVVCLKDLSAPPARRRAVRAE
jgi:hypothetical protein